MQIISGVFFTHMQQAEYSLRTSNEKTTCYTEVTSRKLCFVPFAYVCMSYLQTLKGFNSVDHFTGLIQHFITRTTAQPLTSAGFHQWDEPVYFTHQ